ncbi:DNA-binding protein [Paracoccus limosus]|jgi:hypothetical protein|uniref:DNA-binding protein n=1 Tax=Paracoccus limosus TaxID=913252 RepID=A0A844GYB7_9RHOB|nr:HU family DNA-binding protein [Paracoccus limosus]MTH33666.1 DNA-binding protein [Paracoccus limosus]
MARNGHDKPGAEGNPQSRRRTRIEEDPGTARVLQKRQFLNAVALRSGLRPAQIKEVVEATLAELGDAIASGQTLALPPLGRARVNRQKDVSGSEVIVLRLRRRASDTEESEG